MKYTDLYFSRKSCQYLQDVVLCVVCISDLGYVILSSQHFGLAVSEPFIVKLSLTSEFTYSIATFPKCNSQLIKLECSLWHKSQKEK